MSERKAMTVLGIIAVAAGALFVARAIHASGQSNPTLPAFQINCWHITDPADPIFAIVQTAPPIFLIEIGFYSQTWYEKDHVIQGLLRQSLNLYAREMKIGIPVVARAFVNPDGTGDVPYLFPNGAKGLLRTSAGVVLFYF